MQNLSTPIRVTVKVLPNLGLDRTFYLATVGHEGSTPCEVLGSSRSSALRSAVHQFRGLRDLRRLHRACFPQE